MFPLEGKCRVAAKGCTRPRVEMKRKAALTAKRRPAWGGVSFEALAVQQPPRHFVALSAPVGSVSLDSQVAMLPYESSSLATSRENEKFRRAFLLSADRPGMTVRREGNPVR